MTEKAIQSIAKKLKYRLNGCIAKDVRRGEIQSAAEDKYEKIYKTAMN